ncbi:hypothetical protein QVD17_39260 [Tagetes erecta]|uniref:Uncharacterized protein n=1 Tax=Tagetes erecta TaxID=13708 RepID=A0AAD8JQE0_TARER|nr:hypothetical protein QVD17_39260 [Tagetes erecta]
MGLRRLISGMRLREYLNQGLGITIVKFVSLSRTNKGSTLSLSVHKSRLGRTKYVRFLLPQILIHSLNQIKGKIEVETLYIWNCFGLL